MCAQKYIADKSVHKNMYQTKVWTKIYRGQKCAQKSIADKTVQKKLMTNMRILRRDDAISYITI